MCLGWRPRASAGKGREPDPEFGLIGHIADEGAVGDEECDRTFGIGDDDGPGTLPDRNFLVHEKVRDFAQVTAPAESVTGLEGPGAKRAAEVRAAERGNGRMG